MKKLASSIGTQEMLMLDKNHQLSHTQRELSTAQQEKDELRNSCIKLKLKLQDMRIKYEPGIYFFMNLL